jgi:hypothetical protein
MKAFCFAPNQMMLLSGKSNHQFPTARPSLEENLLKLFLEQKIV